jgi:predicted RNA-binding Zn-ribbon protein involved in translation (DUF1610 family)
MKNKNIKLFLYCQEENSKNLLFITIKNISKNGVIMSNDYNIQNEVQKEILENANRKPTMPFETIELPSLGLYYPENHPLSSGKIDLYYPGAPNENILTSKSLIQKGTVIDVFIQSLIVDKSINIDDMVVGDKNALVVASRILAYGSEYNVEIVCPDCGEKKIDEINLSSLETKECPIKERQLEFKFTLPFSKRVITYKILTQHDETEIEKQIKGLKKYIKGSGVDPEVTTRLQYAILEIDGDSDRNKIKNFVLNELLSRDSLALRVEMKSKSPDIDMNFNFECENCGHTERMVVPLGIEFFWPSK